MCRPHTAGAHELAGGYIQVPNSSLPGTPQAPAQVSPQANAADNGIYYGGHATVSNGPMYNGNGSPVYGDAAEPPFISNGCGSGGYYGSGPGFLAFSLGCGGAGTLPGYATLTVNYSLGGTATNGVDYSGPPAGGGSVPVRTYSTTFVGFYAKPDNLVEGTEAITATIEPGVGYDGVGNTGTSEIRDDPAVVSIDDSASTHSATEPMDPGGATANGIYRIKRVGGDLGKPLPVNYDLTGIADRYGADYTLTGPAGETLSLPSGTVIIPGGGGNITLKPKYDEVIERDEDAILNLKLNGNIVRVGSAGSGVRHIAGAERGSDCDRRRH